MEIIVTESGKGKFNQEITVGSHVLIADEPVESGGNDLGPSPYDFLSCSFRNMYCHDIAYVCRFQKYLLKIIVRLQHEKIHAKDCADCENDNSRIDHIDRQIELQGNLSEEERKKLLDIANKCPVHRTLTSKISITTELI